MIKRLSYFCAVVAVLFVFVTANAVKAQDGLPVAATAVVPAVDCPCVTPVQPCPFTVVGRTPCPWLPCPGVQVCPPIVQYRVGLFGVVRPVYFVPVHRPTIYVPPRVVRPVPVVCPPPYSAWWF